MQLFVKFTVYKEMKKIIISLLFAIVIAGCNNHNKQLGNNGVGTNVQPKTEAAAQNNANSGSMATLSLICGVGGMIVGALGLLIAICSYKKINNTKRIKAIILEEIYKNPKIQDEIRRIVGYLPQSQNSVESAVRTYVNTERFRNLLKQIVPQTTQPAQPIVLQNENRIDNVKRTNGISNYCLFARESNSMILSNVQESYQKGKSVYKLSLSRPDAYTAKINICIDQEEVKQRILKFDKQYLEPICSVSRLSSTPTQVVIREAGAAERFGNEWRVTKPIIVEIK